MPRTALAAKRRTSVTKTTWNATVKIRVPVLAMTPHTEHGQRGTAHPRPQKGIPIPTKEKSMAKTILTVATCAALLWIDMAQAAAPPGPKCQASKNTAVGTYSACRQKAEAKLALTGDTVMYDALIARCE